MYLLITRCGYFPECRGNVVTNELPTDFSQHGWRLEFDPGHLELPSHVLDGLHHDGLGIAVDGAAGRHH
jgi:hypothetical protein